MAKVPDDFFISRQQKMTSQVIADVTSTIAKATCDYCKVKCEWRFFSYFIFEKWIIFFLQLKVLLIYLLS